MTDIEGISFEIVGNASQASRSLRDFSNSLRQVNSSSRSVTGLNKVSNSLSKIVSSVQRIAFYRAIRSAIKAVTDGLSQGMENAYWYSKTVGGEIGYVANAFDRLASASYKADNQLGASLATLKAAVTPILIEITTWITRAADALTQFFAILGGHTTYMKAIDYSKDWADQTARGAASAKEWKNQLMGFDEINRLEEPSSGGGGSGSALPDYENMFREADVSNFAKKISDLISSIKLNFKDVFFDWSNLNAESINKKLIVGLTSVLGAAAGFMIGGIPGAVIGFFIGAGVGLTIDSLIFDNDGKLSKGEVLDMLCFAMAGFVGGVIGFFVGGPGGALLGAALGVGLFTAIKEINFISGGKSSNFTSQLATALSIFAGAAIGFFVGGPGGALLGAAIGLGISALISTIKFNVKDNPERAKYRSGLDWFVVGVLGLPSGAQLKQWGTDAINALRQGLQSAFDGIKRWWSGLSLGAFDFKTPHLSVVWEDIPSDSILARFLGFTAIPHIGVDWYAKGGIVDGATLIGAGEVGKEAIIPLERNTEWISKVAAEMNSQMAKRDTLSAYENGGIEAALENANDGVINAIFAVGSQVVQAMAENNRGGEIDWREVAKKVTKAQNQMARAGAY